MLDPPIEARIRGRPPPNGPSHARERKAGERNDVHRLQALLAVLSNANDSPLSLLTVSHCFHAFWFYFLEKYITNSRQKHILP